MRVPRLPPRLAAVASLVPPGRTVADIGTDHALLPAWLVATGRVPRAIATDLRPGPLAAARRTLDQAGAGVGEKVELRMGRGLSALRPGEVSTIVVAGLGGVNIVRLVGEAGRALDGVSRLVLQPKGAEEEVRLGLERLGWQIVDERLVRERRRFHVAMALESGSSGAPGRAPLTPEDALLGPVLRRQGGPVFRDYVARLLLQTEVALGGIRRARSPDPERLRQLEERARILRSELQRSESQPGGPGGSA